MNYYKTLQIHQNADGKEIKASYRKLSSLHHPDKEDGNAELMAELNKAYACLSDPERRKKYDESGSDDPNEMTTLQEGRQVFLELFTSLLSSQPDYDFLPKIKEILDKKLEEIKDNAASSEARKKYLSNKVKTFKCTSPTNLIEAVIFQQISRIEEQIKNCEKGTQIVLASIEEWKNYSSIEKRKQEESFGIYDNPFDLSPENIMRMMHMRGAQR